MRQAGAGEERRPGEEGSNQVKTGESPCRSRSRIEVRQINGDAGEGQHNQAKKTTVKICKHGGQTDQVHVQSRKIYQMHRLGEQANQMHRQTDLIQRKAKQVSHM